jgi:hypothetical protein
MKTKEEFDHKIAKKFVSQNGRIRSQLEMRMDPKHIRSFIIREPIHLEGLLIRFEELLFDFTFSHAGALSIRHLF